MLINRNVVMMDGGGTRKKNPENETPQEKQMQNQNTTMKTPVQKAEGINVLPSLWRQNIEGIQPPESTKRTVNMQLYSWQPQSEVEKLGWEKVQTDYAKAHLDYVNQMVSNGKVIDMQRINSPDGAEAVYQYHKQTLNQNFKDYLNNEAWKNYGPGDYAKLAGEIKAVEKLSTAVDEDALQVYQNRIHSMWNYLTQTVAYGDGSYQTERQRLQRELDKYQNEIASNANRLAQLTAVAGETEEATAIRRIMNDLQIKADGIRNSMTDMDGQIYEMRMQDMASRAESIPFEGGSLLQAAEKGAEVKRQLKEDQRMLAEIFTTATPEEAAEKAKLEERIKAANAWLSATEQLANKNGVDFGKLSDYYQRQKDKEWTEMYSKSLSEGSKEHPVAASALSVGFSMLEGLGFASEVGQTVANWFREPEDRIPVNIYDGMHFGTHGKEAIRSTVGGEINQKLDDLGYDTLGDWAEKGYHLTMGAADTVAAAWLTGNAANGLISNPDKALKVAKYGTQLLSSSGEASRAYVQAIQSGKSDQEAFSDSMITIASEFLADEVDLDNLWKGKPLKIVSKQGTEEVMAEIAQTGLDVLINGDQSELLMSYESYQRQGYSKPEATMRAIFDQLQAYGEAYVMGLISETGSKAVGKVTQQLQTKWEAAGEALQSKGLTQAVLDAADRLPEGSSARQLARKIMKTAETRRLEHAESYGWNQPYGPRIQLGPEREYITPAELGRLEAEIDADVRRVMGKQALTEPGGSGTLDTKVDFYVSPAGEAIEGKYESWIGRNRRDEMMERAENQRLKNVVGQIYRADSVIGDGSLADRMMLEQQRGLPLQPQTMQSIMEASEYLRTLAQLKTLSASDIRLANMLLRKLELARGK